MQEVSSLIVRGRPRCSGIRAWKAIPVPLPDVLPSAWSYLSRVHVVRSWSGEVAFTESCLITDIAGYPGVRPLAQCGAVRAKRR